MFIETNFQTAHSKTLLTSVDGQQSRQKNLIGKKNKPVMDIILELLNVSEDFCRRNCAQTLFRTQCLPAKCLSKKKINETP